MLFLLYFYTYVMLYISFYKIILQHNIADAKCFLSIKS